MFNEMGMPRWWLRLVVAFSVCAQLTSGYFEEKRRPIYLNGLVGSFVVFNCKIQFPLDTPVPYILHWYKDVSVYTLMTIIENQKRIFMQ